MKKVNDVSKKKLYKTNEVCEMFDISRATLFRWEREGLITRPPRDWRPLGVASHWTFCHAALDVAERVF